MASILPSQAVQRLFPSKISALEELAAYAEGKELTAAGAALGCPADGFFLVPSEASAPAGGAARRPGAGLSSSAALPRKGAPTTARGFSGMAPPVSGASVVKSTLVKKEEGEEGGARVQIDHVVVTGTGPDDACNAFEANPFKPESEWGAAAQGGGRALAEKATLAAHLLKTPHPTPPPPLPHLSVCKRCRKMKTKHAGL